MYLSNCFDLPIYRYILQLRCSRVFPAIRKHVQAFYLFTTLFYLYSVLTHGIHRVYIDSILQNVWLIYSQYFSLIQNFSLFLLMVRRKMPEQSLLVSRLAVEALVVLWSAVLRIFSNPLLALFFVECRTDLDVVDLVRLRCVDP